MLTRRSLIKALGALTPGYWLGKGEPVELPGLPTPSSAIFDRALPITPLQELTPAKLTPALEDLYRQWDRSRRSFATTMPGSMLHHDVNQAIRPVWRTMVEDAGLRLLPNDKQFYTNRDRLYTEHNDAVQGMRVLVRKYSFDVEEGGEPIVATPSCNGLLMPLACFPSDNPFILGGFYLRGDPAVNFAQAVAGSLQSTLEQLTSRGDVLAVGDAVVHIRLEHYILEFFTYVSVWVPGASPR
jgi:hypothetical protein